MVNNVAVTTSTGYYEHDVEVMNTLKRIIFITDEIDDKLATKVINYLIYYDAISDEPITFMINSPGGSVQAGLNIYNAMNAVKSPIRTVAFGCAASMAGVLFAAGDKGERYIFPDSKVMIHEPLISEIHYLKVSNVIKLGDEMTGIKDKVSKILADCTGKTVEQINEDTKEDKYLNADEAIEYGIADKIFTENILR